MILAVFEQQGYVWPVCLRDEYPELHLLPVVTWVKDSCNCTKQKHLTSMRPSHDNCLRDEPRHADFSAVRAEIRSR